MVNDVVINANQILNTHLTGINKNNIKSSTLIFTLYTGWCGTNSTVDVDNVTVNYLSTNNSSYSGIWYDPTKSGQGVALSIDASSLSGAWYLYDANGKDMWVTFVGSISNSIANVSLLEFEGPHLGDNWNPSLVTNQVIGTANISFQTTEQINMSYVINGVSGALSLERFGGT